jgi:hypothetical protein
MGAQWRNHNINTHRSGTHVDCDVGATVIILIGTLSSRSPSSFFFTFSNFSV